MRRLKSLRDSIVNPTSLLPGWQSGLIQRSRTTLWSLYAAGSRPVVSQGTLGFESQPRRFSCSFIFWQFSSDVLQPYGWSARTCENEGISYPFIHLFSGNAAAGSTHHFPTHALRMSTHTRSAVPGMDNRSSVGKAAQVSGE